MVEMLATAPTSSGKAKGFGVKTKAQQQDDSIMGTNNSSIVSKRSVERLYHPNEPQYFRHFVKKPQRRAPLINRGYWLRMRAIDHVVRQFLEQSSDKKKVVVNLGCGYDPLPWQCLYRHPSVSRDVLFVDIDYKDLMMKKCSVVNSTDQLLSGLTNVGQATDEIIFRSDQYVQLGCDLRNLPALQESLAKVVDIANSSLLFVAEVSITYMDMRSTDALIQWAGNLPSAKFCLLEQLMPAGDDHPFAQTMMTHFNKLKTFLYSVSTYPTTDAQENRFRRLGWQSAFARNLWDLWSSDYFLQPEERKALDLVEPFDEWEEFALFGCHYVLLVASTNSDTLEDLTRLPENDINSSLDNQPSIPSSDLSIRYSEYPKGKGCNRFASSLPYRASQSQRDLVGVFGGMGLNTRTNDIDVYSNGNDSPFVFESELSSTLPSARMCHTSAELEDATTLLVGGRVSPDKALTDCWLYHKWLNIWERVEDLPHPLYRHQALYLGSGFVFVTPGRISSRAISSDYLVWHRRTGWRKCAVTGVSPFATFGSVVFLHNDCRGKGFEEEPRLGTISGGIAEDGVVQTTMWHWNLVGLTQKTPTLSFTQATNSPSEVATARFGASTMKLNGVTFIVGGITKGRIIDRQDEIYSIGQHIGSIGRVKLESTNVPRPLLIGTTLASIGEDLVISGGSAVCFSFGTFWNKGCYAISSKLDSDGNGLTPEPNSGERDLPWSYVETIKLVPKPLFKGPAAVTAKDGERSITRVPRIHVESPDEFRELVQVSKPVILAGLDIGSCTSLWSAEYLREKVADKQVVVHKSMTKSMDFVAKNFSYETMSFDAFLTHINDGQKLYLRSLSTEKPSDLPADINVDFPTIAPDFRLPSELSLVRENMHSAPLRISAGVSMWLHYDVMANVLCQVRGTKRLLLFPPTDVKHFGFQPGTSSSSVDVFDSLNHYPGARLHEVILHPGDVLFLPALWLHAASPGDGMSISVNVFFRNLPFGYSSGRDVYGNRDLQAYEKGRQDIQKILKSFEGLPQDVRGFYLQRLVDEFEAKTR